MSKPENKKDKPASIVITAIAFLILGGGVGTFAFANESGTPVPAETTIQAPTHSTTTGDAGADLNSEFENVSSGGSLGK